MASEIWSATLSGCPSETDSEVNMKELDMFNDQPCVNNGKMRIIGEEKAKIKLSRGPGGKSVIHRFDASTSIIEVSARSNSVMLKKSEGLESKRMVTGPRQIETPYRPIPLEVPEGMKPNEFFNSTENLNDLVHNNGLLKNSENLLMYRKALGHSNLFDASIIYNTSQMILDPLGRPVRRTQVPENVCNVWNRMNQVMIGFRQ